MHKLPDAFYLRTDVLEIARDLLGKVLVTNFAGQRCAARITEVEAYRAPDDRASHAYGNKRTPRTSVMFEAGGRAYIYLCYGIHHLFNVVTGPEGMAHAVLIRGIEPLEGLEHMLRRRGAAKLTPALTTGPGALSQAMGLQIRWNAVEFNQAEAPVWIEEGKPLPPDEIACGKRIGVDYAGICAAWEWRFWVAASPYVKRV